MSRSSDDPPVIDERARRLHDLRQPLAAILAAATAIRQEIPADPATRDRFLQIIIDNAVRLSDMLDPSEARD